MNMKSNLAQEATPYNDCDFLIGDAVVIDQAMMNFNEIYQITEVYENTVNVYIGIGILTLKVCSDFSMKTLSFVRSA